MAFNTGAALLDALVLSTAEREPTYGYRITQQVRQIMVVSESTLYPVLRRLQKEGCLETYDQEFAGRNRRYYRLTETGAETLARLRTDWVEYRDKIDAILLDEGDAQ
ncbi:MAG TPA: PadR family transcriptional regulator [Candidatus Fournierella excrementigallinarum]|nr:PadR family transcriptional regulator [Candidatus Fournierella excrementigallinarum]